MCILLYIRRRQTSNMNKTFMFPSDMSITTVCARACVCVLCMCVNYTSELGAAISHTSDTEPPQPLKLVCLSTGNSVLMKHRVSAQYLTLDS